MWYIFIAALLMKRSSRFSNLVPLWILILQKFPSFKFLISTSAASQPLLQAQEEFQLRRPFEQSK